MIENGSTVAINYTLTLDDGTKVDSSEGREPLTYQQGDGQILPALEQALEGLDEGAEKKVSLSPEEGYGVVDPEAFRKVEVNVVPEEARQAGATLVAQSPEGQQVPVRVHEVGDEAIILDWNHPLAGQNLHFEIEVVSIDAANA